MKNNVKSMIIAMLFLAACFAISWIVTCGIIKLITLCLGLKFNWAVATGIWLIIFVLKQPSKLSRKNNK